MHQSAVEVPGFDLRELCITFSIYLSIPPTDLSVIHQLDEFSALRIIPGVLSSRYKSIDKSLR